MQLRIIASVLPNALLGTYPLGLLCFKFALLRKWLGSFAGEWTQRVVEYPWVVNYIHTLKEHSLVLDIGCSESLFNQSLVKSKFRVVGLDIRENLFPNKYLHFIKRNVTDTGLPSNLFDAICVVSTIEHIGLSSYCQKIQDSDGDIQALRELSRVLKKGGSLIVTTPYVGRNALHVDLFERHYNRKRLERLIEGFRVLKEDYFYPYKSGGRLLWLKMSRKKMDSLSFRAGYPGIACLVLCKY